MFHSVVLESVRKASKMMIRAGFSNQGRRTFDGPELIVIWVDRHEILNGTATSCN